MVCSWRNVVAGGGAEYVGFLGGEEIGGSKWGLLSEAVMGRVYLCTKGVRRTGVLS